MIVDLYCRVSTDEQVREGYSLESQERRLKMYAESMGWLVNKCYIDGGYSGKNLERPGIQSVIMDAKQKKIGKVVVAMLDRLSRSQKDTMHLIEDVFLANGVDFVSMHETLDTSTPVGRAMIGVLAVFAQLERDQITERLSNGRSERVKSGLFRGGGKIPIGYRYIPEKNQLVIEPEEAQAVRDIYERFNAGETLGSIARYLRDERKADRITFSPSHVARIIENPIYIGKMRWNGEVIDMTDPVPIVSEETYNQAMKRRAATKLESKSQTSKVGVTLLSGMIWCGVCGHRFSWRDDPKIRENWKRRYCCASRQSSSRRNGVEPCRNKTIPCADLDALILSEVRQLATDRSLLDDAQKNQNTKKIELESIEKRLVEIDKQLNRLIDLYMIGTVDAAQISKRTKSLNEERDRLSNRLEELNSEETESFDDFDKNLSRFMDLIDTAEQSELSLILRSLIKRIVINGEDISIEWSFE